jgi:predicted SAM-dependent methyltransferase
MTGTAFGEAGVIATLNQRGHTSKTTNEYSEAFFQFLPECTAPVLDIGAAFGVCTLPALAAGATVVACDIEARHLDALLQNCPPEHQSRLVPIIAQFPAGPRLADGSLDAVHAANLLNYLTGEEITRAAELIFGWLRPGGQVFTISGSPYAANVQEFIPVYEERKRAGADWPGEARGLHDLCSHPSVQDLPDFLHLLDAEVLVNSFEAAGFVIRRAELFERAGLPEYLRWDGRENVGLIARKVA